MRMTREDDVAGRTSRCVEDFQQRFDANPRGATVQGLCGKFAMFLKDVLPESGLSFHHRESGGSLWTRIETGSSNGLNGDGEPQPRESPPSFELEDRGAGLHAYYRLGDGSCILLRASRDDSATPFTEVDLLSLRLFIQLFDTVIQRQVARRTEKDLVFSLNHRVLQLTSLIDTGIEVSRLDTTIPPQQLALERAASLTNASCGLLTVAGADGSLQEFAFPHAWERQRNVSGETGISSTFTFHHQTYSFQLFDKESRDGVHSFDETDQMLLDALVRQVHASLENRFLHAQSLEKQKIEQDIAVAASIQQRILPKDLPIVQGYDFAGINIPSKSVGGDYYDCIPLTDGRYALVIADVSGKGVPAALLVSSLHAYLSAYLESAISVVDLARRLNRVIWNAATEDKFITAFLAILAPETGELISVNAGHTPVYLLRNDGSVQELTAGGVPFGMLEMDFPYTPESIVMERGERLLLYTDGIPEAMNAEGELYDKEQSFKAFFTRRVSPTARKFVDDLVAEMKAFMGDAPQADDITALYVIRH